MARFLNGWLERAAILMRQRITMANEEINMEIVDLFDFMDALRRQDSASDFIDSDGLGTALEELVECELGKPNHGSRNFYNSGYKLDMLYVTVYYEQGCSCCRESENHTVSYTTLWNHLVKNDVVKDIE